MKIVAAIFCGVFVAGSLPGQEWTRFRGPNGGGVSEATTVPAKFTEADFNWKVAIAGEGHSSPVVWGERIFLTANDPGRAGAKRQVICLSAKDGEQLWAWDEEYKPHANNDQFNNFASATPAVDGERVYVSWTTGDTREVVALTHEGVEAWRVSRAGFDKTDHGSAASPIIAEGLLVVSNESSGSDSSVFALDPATGDLVWELKRENEKDVYSTPILVELGGVKALVLVGTSHGFTGVDPKTGKVVWQYDPKFKMRSVGSPVVVGESVFAILGQGGGGQEAAAVHVKDGKAELTYETKVGLPYVPTPLVRGDLMYFLNDAGLLSCVRGSDGTKVYDRERLVTGKSAKWFSSPICVGGNIYCASTDGLMVVVAAGPEFQEVGRFQFDEGINATPAVSGGKMYVRTAGHLISIGK